MNTTTEQGGWEQGSSGGRDEGARRVRAAKQRGQRGGNKAGEMRRQL